EAAGCWIVEFFSLAASAGCRTPPRYRNSGPPAIGSDIRSGSAQNSDPFRKRPRSIPSTREVALFAGGTAFESGKLRGQRLLRIRIGAVRAACEQAKDADEDRPDDSGGSGHGYFLLRDALNTAYGRRRRRWLRAKRMSPFSS